MCYLTVYVYTMCVPGVPRGQVCHILWNYLQMVVSQRVDAGT